MSLAKGLDAPVAKVTHLLLGLNELYKDNMPGLENNVSRIEKISGMIALAAKKEVATVEQISTGMAYVGSLAKTASVPLEDIIALTARLNTNLVQGGKAGTGLRQMLNAIAKNADKLNKSFNLGIDSSKPPALFDILERLGTRLSSGQITTGALEKVMGGFNLRGAVPAILSAEQIQHIKKLSAELKLASIENVTSMRDIMENTVPEQWKIFTKNIDLAGAALLRGAIGGKEMAGSLKNVNALMPELSVAAKSLGDVLGVLLSKQGLMIGIGAGVIHWGVAAVKSYNAVSVAAAGTAKATAALKFANVALFGVVGAIAAVAWGINRYYEQIERNVERSGKALRDSVSAYHSLADVASVIPQIAKDQTELAKVKEILAKRAKELGMQFNFEAASAKDLLEITEKLQAAQQKKTEADRKVYISSVRAKLQSIAGGPWVQAWRSASAVASGLHPGTAGAAAIMDRGEEVLNLADEMAGQLKSAGLSEKEISAAMEDALRPVVNELNAAQFWIGKGEAWENFATRLRAIQISIDNRIAKPLEKMADDKERPKIVPLSARGSASALKLLEPAAQEAVSGRTVTIGGQEVQLHGRALQRHALGQMRRDKGMANFASAFNARYGIDKITAQIIANMQGTNQAHLIDEAMQAFYSGSPEMLAHFPQVVEAIKQHNPFMLRGMHAYNTGGGVAGTMRQFYTERTGLPGSRLSNQDIADVLGILDKQYQKSELQSNTEAIKTLTQEIAAYNNSLKLQQQHDAIEAGKNAFAMSAYSADMFRRFNLPPWLSYNPSARPPLAAAAGAHTAAAFSSQFVPPAIDAHGIGAAAGAVGLGAKLMQSIVINLDGTKIAETITTQAETIELTGKLVLDGIKSVLGIKNWLTKSAQEAARVSGAK